MTMLMHDKEIAMGARAEGLAEGEAKGLAKGRAEGRADEIIRMLRKYNNADNGRIIEELANELDYSYEQAEQYLWDHDHNEE